MIPHYEDYYWKNGKPYGLKAIDPSATPLSYKIVVDPYYRRFSVEKYRFNHFDKLLYDSYLLDFRHLKPMNQTAWQKEQLSHENDIISCLIRNQDDRTILKETHYFEQGRPRLCKIESVHGTPLSTHRIFYADLGDSFNGVTLFDLEERIVMTKKYAIDSSTHEFTELLEECWDMQHMGAHGKD